MLELGEEGFDTPALLVGDAIIGMLVFAMAARWDDRFTALVVDEIMQAVSVIGAISQDLASRDAADQVAGGCHVVLLAGTEDEADRQAKGIDYGVDLGAKPASRTAESLGLNAPLFTRAPAAWA